MDIFECKVCKKNVEVIKASKCPTMCCGHETEELISGTSDDAFCFLRSLWEV